MTYKIWWEYNMFFHSYLEHGIDPNEENETSGIQDVCSITLDKAPCGVRLCGFIYSYQENFDFCNIQWRLICCLQLTDAVASVANVLHCAARTDLQMTEHTIMRLVHELTGRLNSLVRELAKAVSSPLKKQTNKKTCHCEETSNKWCGDLVCLSRFWVWR